MAADEIELFLCGFVELAVLFAWCSWAELMSGRERSVAIGASRAVCAVVPRGANVLVDSSAADRAAGVSGAFCRIAEALTAWVVPSDRRLLVDSFGKLAGVE